jgi:hypothetical protein
MMSWAKLILAAEAAQASRTGSAKLTPTVAAPAMTADMPIKRFSFLVIRNLLPDLASTSMRRLEIISACHSVKLI